MDNYFDYAAGTPLDPKVLKAMEPYFIDLFYNPSALYDSSRRIKSDIRSSRETVARILGARTSEIIFTAGATEANNLAIKGIMDRFPDKNIIISAIEHESVVKPAEKYNFKVAKVNQKGLLDLDNLAKLIDEDTVMISIIYANNEIGTVQSIKSVAELIEEVRQRRKKSGNQTPIYLHTDSAQAVNYLDIHVSRLGVDLMSINGGKIYGPKQSGLLYVRTGLVLEPLILGGGQEKSLRSGTENVPAIIGLAKALEITDKLKKKESERLKNLQTLFLNLLKEKGVDFILNGTAKNRLPNNINLSFPGKDNETLMILLDNAGLMVATGSACSASSQEPSHVLKAIGLSDEEIAGSLRITLGRQTTEDSIKRLVNQLKIIV